MPWEKQFDETEVLEKATRAFWRKGFKGTSMKDLVAATGLNPGSIYATFRDKRHLFQRCLAHFEEAGAAKRAALAAQAAPREAVLGLFDLMAKEEVLDSREGCLLINSALEAGEDAEVAAAVRRALQDLEAFIAGRIAAGQADGSIPKGRDPEALARLIMGMIVAVRVFARAWPDHPYVIDARANAAALLGAA